MQNMEQQQIMEHLERQVQQVDLKVEKVLRLLTGNELDKDDKGMIGVQNDHEKRISQLEKLRDRLIWFAFGLTFFAGWGVIDIVQKVLLKK